MDKLAFGSMWHMALCAAKEPAGHGSKECRAGKESKAACFSGVGARAAKKVGRSVSVMYRQPARNWARTDKQRSPGAYQPRKSSSVQHVGHAELRPGGRLM